MVEAFNSIIEWFKDYYGDYIFLVLSVVAAIYLIAINRKRYLKLIIPSICLYLVCFNPVLYKYVFFKIIFWRLFWMIPTTLIIVLAVGELFKRCEKYTHKILVMVGVILVVLVIGNNVFTGASLGKNNKYRLPQETIDIGQTMLEYDETPKCIVSSGLLTSIRLYSGNIEPMYGRNAQGYINRASDEVYVMYAVMESEAPDYNYVLTRAMHWGYNFVVNVDTKPISDHLLDKYGYELIKNIDGYNVYFNPNMNDEMLEGYSWRYDNVGWWLEDEDGNSITQSVKTVYGVNYYINGYGYVVDSIDSDTAKNIQDGDIIVTQFGNDSYDKPSMFYTIDDQKGHFTIVDGGNDDEYETVLSQIELYGNKVDSWIITHPHDDHVGAFNYIYQNYGKDFEIGTIYAIDIDSDYYHKVANEWDRIEYYDEFNDIVDEYNLKSKIKFVKAGEEYKLGEVPFKVYNCFDEDSYSIDTGSLPNATTMVFELFGNNESMLFLGDLEQESADSIEERYGTEISANYVQAAHHGQNVDYSFYEIIGANTVFVDAPEWLRQEDDNNHTSYEHIEYFKENNYEILTYDTTPNTILLK